MDTARFENFYLSILTPCYNAASLTSIRATLATRLPHVLDHKDGLLVPVTPTDSTVGGGMETVAIADAVQQVCVLLLRNAIVQYNTFKGLCGSLLLAGV